MATTYSSTKVGSTYQARSGIDATWTWETYEAAVALVVNDVIEMVKVPINATILEVILIVDDLDSGTNLVLEVGDGSDTDRFISGSTIGQGGGTVRLGSGLTGSAAADAGLYQYTAADTIDIKVNTAPAGGGTGTLKLGVCYSLNS